MMLRTRKLSFVSFAKYYLYGAIATAILLLASFAQAQNQLVLTLFNGSTSTAATRVYNNQLGILDTSTMLLLDYDRRTYKMNPITRKEQLFAFMFPGNIGDRAVFVVPYFYKSRNSKLHELTEAEQEAFKSKAFGAGIRIESTRMRGCRTQLWPLNMGDGVTTKSTIRVKIPPTLMVSWPQQYSVFKSIATALFQLL